MNMGKTKPKTPNQTKLPHTNKNSEKGKSWKLDLLLFAQLEGITEALYNCHWVPNTKSHRTSLAK